MIGKAKRKHTIEVGFPFTIDSYGRVADPDYPLHVEQMIELVLFTVPGERVNRPEFGCGLLQLIFGPDTNAVASATDYLVQMALNRWLGDVIRVQSVEVRPVDSQLQVRIAYVILDEQVERVSVFEAPGVPWEP